MKNKEHEAILHHRLKTIDGHMQKVIKMVHDKEYCIDILQQTTAVKRAISRVEELILEQHMNSCVIKHMRSGKSKKAIDELMSVFRSLNKK